MNAAQIVTSLKQAREHALLTRTEAGAAAVEAKNSRTRARQAKVKAKEARRRAKRARKAARKAERRADKLHRVARKAEKAAHKAEKKARKALNKQGPSHASMKSGSMPPSSRAKAQSKPAAAGCRSDSATKPMRAKTAGLSVRAAESTQISTPMVSS